MSEFDSRVDDAMDREATYVGTRMDENREQQWSAKRRDDESLRSGLERETESLDDPPEKISLDEKPYDRFARHADLRDYLEKAVDQSFYNSANAEKSERYISDFELLGQQIQRSHGVDGVTGLRQMLQIDEGLRSPDFNTRVATMNHLVNIAHQDSDYAAAT